MEEKPQKPPLKTSPTVLIFVFSIPVPCCFPYLTEAQEEATHSRAEELNHGSHTAQEVPGIRAVAPSEGDARCSLSFIQQGIKRVFRRSNSPTALQTKEEGRTKAALEQET